MQCRRTLQRSAVGGWLVGLRLHDDLRNLGGCLGVRAVYLDLGRAVDLDPAADAWAVLLILPVELAAVHVALGGVVAHDCADHLRRVALPLFACVVVGFAVLGCCSDVAIVG